MGDPRVWLITGTSSGLGRALTEAVAATGDLVIATARHPEALNDLVARYPEQIWATRLDVTDRAAVEPLIIEMGARFGRIDVLVNNAGHGHVNSAEQTRDAVVRELFELHVFGPAAAAPSSRCPRWPPTSGCPGFLPTVPQRLRWKGFRRHWRSSWAHSESG